MKKLIILFIFTLIPLINFSQKKKASPKKAPVSTNVIASLENITLEKVKEKLCVFIQDKNKKDTIFLRAIDSKFSPKDARIVTHISDKTKLFYIVFTENIFLKTDLKTEDLSLIQTYIIEPISKKIVFENLQKTTKITEIVFLDKLKTASETKEKIKREGQECIINADGSIILKNKTTQSKLIYQASNYKFIASK